MRINHHAVTIAAGLLATFMRLSPALAGDLTVTATAGQVTLIEHGRPVPPAVGVKLSLPVEIHTGSDGSVDVQQLGSSLHVGPNSTIALPGSASRGGAVDKIKQSAGYVLYNIKSRKDHPLSVETPYLVSVVKGTVFTIAVEEHAATVALMEGSLDISAPGVTEHVLLEPNQSIRHADGESRLSVHSSAAASAMPRSGLRVDAPLVLPGATQSDEMALVARDLADTGAAVTAGHAIAAHQVAQSSGASASGTNSAATGSGAANGGGSGSSSTPGVTGASTSTGSGGSASGTTGSASSGGSSGSNSSPGGSSGGSGSGGSSSSGSNSSGSNGSGSSGGGTTTGSSGTGSSGTTGGSVTLPSSGSGSSNAGTGNCNGKNNGTGSGNCYGHQSGHGSK